ncbi:MAG: hypothetical protein ACM32J_04845 [Rhizobacter sp.]|jgi:hypothetical protein
MPQPISDRLLARVERSLRKRVSLDVRPHLARCAAQARSDEDFLAAAARLLASPREREGWLASWLVRRSESDDTAPAPLDGAGTPAPEGLPSGPAPFAQHSFRISPAQRERLRDALAHELGPIATLLIETEAARSASAGELLARLQTHLDDEAQRTRFVQATLSRFPRDV